MRNYEKRKVMRKLTALAGKKLRAITASKKWTGREISQHTGVPESRISELKHHRRYPRLISVKIFGQLLKGGVLRPFDINLIGNLSDREREYINSLIRNIFTVK